MENGHYIDEGCICNECSKKRNILYEKLKCEKVEIIEKIKHVEKKRNVEKRNEVKKKDWKMKYN